MTKGTLFVDKDSKPKPTKDNMTKDQRTTLKELKQKVKEREIRISKADKGGAVVVQDCEKYIQEAKTQLDNPLHYTKLTKDPTSQIVQTSIAIVANLYDKGDIDKTTKDWAVTDENKKFLRGRKNTPVKGK